MIPDPAMRAVLTRERLSVGLFNSPLGSGEMLGEGELPKPLKSIWLSLAPSTFPLKLGEGLGLIDGLDLGMGEGVAVELGLGLVVGLDEGLGLGIGVGVGLGEGEGQVLVSAIVTGVWVSLLAWLPELV